MNSFAHEFNRVNFTNLLNNTQQEINVFFEKDKYPH